jgi:hypothetical protein
MEKKLRLFNTTTGANLLVFPPGDSWSVCPNGKYLAVARGNDIQIWDLPPRRPAPLIVVLAVLHTALILGPCWYFARHRATEAAE